MVLPTSHILQGLLKQATSVFPALSYLPYWHHIGYRPFHTTNTPDIHWLPSLPPNSLPSWHHNDYPPSITTYLYHVKLETHPSIQPTLLTSQLLPSLIQPTLLTSYLLPSVRRSLHSWHHMGYHLSNTTYPPNSTLATLRPWQPNS